MLSESLPELLLSRRLSSGLWSWTGMRQGAIEPTCFAYLALRSDPLYAHHLDPDALLKMQLADGSWPVIPGDRESSWATALAVSALGFYERGAEARSRAIEWLLQARGKEAHWFWKWKFKWTERAAPIDPEQFGWPWFLGAASWVIPTALTIVVLKQWTNCKPEHRATDRTKTGTSMLLDRRCIEGGWNAGNPVVYGSALPPHIEPTAVALLGLQGMPSAETVRSVDWLYRAADRQSSIEALSWSVLTLFLYGRSIQALKAKLWNRVNERENIADNFTLALAILALRCGEMIHPFEVLA
ncbi:MAG: hypothetical protein ACR2NN_08495 [Bryobacteraceae bacterium]